jgi:hypothetical protein
MSLKARMKRAQQEAHAGGVIIELGDGSRKVFDSMAIQAQMFLTRCDLFRGVSRPSEVLEAVRAATPESRRRFEEQYGSIEMEARVVAADYQGGWVEVFKLDERGMVTKRRHESGSQETERIREEARWGA